MVLSDLNLELGKVVKSSPQDQVAFSEMWYFRILKLPSSVDTTARQENINELGIDVEWVQ
jgi:hypothetical protein